MLERILRHPPVCTCLTVLDTLSGGQAMAATKDARGECLYLTVGHNCKISKVNTEGGRAREGERWQSLLSLTARQKGFV